jgi:hypothetical protein
MNNIRLEINGHFIDLSNQNIRFDYAANTFFNEVCPLKISFPIKLSLTQEVKNALKLIYLPDSSEQYHSSANGKLWINAKYDEVRILFGKYVSDSHVNITIVSVANEDWDVFLDKKLADLDYKEWNEKWLPESYRYAIGYMFMQSASPTDIKIRIGSGMSTIDYLQVWTGDYTTTMNALIEQINDDTSTHNAEATLLGIVENLDFANTARGLILVKGVDQFSIHPQTISAVPADITYVNLIQNYYDIIIGGSAIANHMRGLAEDFTRDAYKLAFGEFPWIFPMIYAPEYYESREVNNIYDYFINTFDFTTQRYLIRPIVATQMNVQWPNYPVCPCIYIKWLMEQVFREIGYELETDIFDNAEIASLILLTINSQDAGNSLPPSYVPNIYWDIRKSMPDISVNSFLLAIKKLFTLTYEYDTANKIVKAYSFSKIKNNNTSIRDLTGSTKSKFESDTHEYYKNGFLWEYIFDASDGYTSEIVNIDKFTRQADVANQAALPTSGNLIGDLRKSLIDQQFFTPDIQPSPDVWSLVGYDFIAHKTLAGKEDLTMDISPLLMINRPSRKTGESIDEEDVVTPILVEQNIRCPRVKYRGESMYYRTDESKILGRIVFYRGMNLITSSGVLKYPYASSDELAPDGTVDYDYSLRLDSDQGLYINFLKPLADWLSVTKKVDFELILDVDDDLKLTDIIRIESIDYLVMGISKTIVSNFNKTVYKISAYKL